MHLLNTSTHEVKEFPYGKIPPYIILSHRWGDEEVSYRDLTEPKKDPSTLKGWTKLDSFCSLAKQDGWEWVWMDTCCIDKSSSAELSEAINSMYQWYTKSEFCIAYLADISVFKDETGGERKLFEYSEWFKRGWTLQELLASREVVFYDKNWEIIGTRTALKAYVSRATRISNDHLSKPLIASVAAKMSWAAKRQTSRPEDVAYSLLGLFEVNMPLLYGEGGFKAYIRLQYEIVRSRRDESIFAWTRLLGDPLLRAPGLLAPSPENFFDSGNIVPIHNPTFGHAKLHVPQILFDGLVWTIERSFKKNEDPKNDDPKIQKTLARTSFHYVAPLACAKDSDRSTPVKLRMIEYQNKSLRRWPSTRLELLSPSEMQDLQNAQAQTYHLIQEQLRAPRGKGFTHTIPPGFTLRLSKSAQNQCSKPCKFGPGVGLHNNGESGEYIVLSNEINQYTVGIIMQHKGGAVIKVTCEKDKHRFWRAETWRLLMEINTKKFGIVFGDRRSDRLSGDESINLGDRAFVTLEQGQNISVSPKHGLKEGENTVVVCIDCDAENPDLHGIFDGGFG